MHETKGLLAKGHVREIEQLSLTAVQRACQSQELAASLQELPPASFVQSPASHLPVPGLPAHHAYSLIHVIHTLQVQVSCTSSRCVMVSMIRSLHYQMHIDRNSLISMSLHLE